MKYWFKFVRKHDFDIVLVLVPFFILKLILK